MQSSTTNINRGHIPPKLSVFVFGHNDDDDDPKSVKKFPEYDHEVIENSFSIDSDNDDDDNLILSALSTIEENINETDNNSDVQHQNINNSHCRQTDKQSPRQSINYDGKRINSNK
ncbi:unnamed protein product [Rotaria sordida]|uniref:Uncharacterized protein n=1 Tax=Rotaria sordida TaxID=392033 RepID=A0A815DJB5_9BILA|nr:unnamed protein product [Rotaria sordida]CAF1091419.1 unnamed protein product [Rotaria sordida]CAF1095763.1 unnamed protein product [Rotaria sordida]CAF1131841.1 unnamed protein product [Rotaria sordida]CAF1302351.1 unnamed protein product [Rotaria sordida]